MGVGVDDLEAVDDGVAHRGPPCQRSTYLNLMMIYPARCFLRPRPGGDRALTADRCFVMIIMIYSGSRGRHDCTAGRRSCARGGHLRLRAVGGRHPRRLGRRRPQGRASGHRRPRSEHRGLGRAGRRRRRVAPLGGGQPRQAGHDAGHLHARGQGDPAPPRGRVRRVPHELPASGAPEARHRARGHPEPEPPDRVRTWQRAGPPRCGVRARRLRRPLVLGAVRRGDRRDTAGPRVRPRHARAGLRRPPVRRRAGRPASRPLCTRSAGPARASSSTSRSCPWACGAWA